jgi:hypothetical protein
MDCQNNTSCGAGKGDKPRNCFSQKYRDNYDAINWLKKENENNNTNVSNIDIVRTSEQN